MLLCRAKILFVVHPCGLNMLFEIQRILSLCLLEWLQQWDQPSLIHSSRCNRIIENGCNSLYTFISGPGFMALIRAKCIHFWETFVSLSGKMSSPSCHPWSSSSLSLWYLQCHLQSNDPRYFHFWCSLVFGKIRKIFESVNSLRTTSS